MERRKTQQVPLSVVSSRFFSTFLLLLGFGSTCCSSAQLLHACDGSTNASLATFAFCNVELRIEARVQDLLARLTVDEKLAQMEALHGVASSPGVQFGGAAPAATSFPMPITTAASFNTNLFNKIGQAVSTEARALYNLGRSGLTFWSPNVNIFRDPRWGRGQETPGEDPLLSSKFATYYVRGLQEGGYEEGEEQEDEAPRIKVSACCKHVTAYDVDNWKGMDRYHFNAEVTEQDLIDTYNPPFQSCVVEGRVSSVMCSYNRVNGVPTCADQSLLSGTVRNSWGLNGYIVSDCDALRVFYEDTGYAPSPEDAVADSILAGLDLNCGTFLAQHAAGALKAGKISETDIDRAVFNLVKTRMRLGLFDGPNATHQPYAGLGEADICSEEHQQLALDAALQGTVLLKNDGSLPFSANTFRSVALIGPNANASRTMLGNYEGVPCKYVSPLQGLQAYTNVLYARGCSNVACSSGDSIAEAVHVATKADGVVLVVGLDQSQETETHDRTSLLLPGMQSQLISAVLLSVTSPVVLVVMSAGPVDISQFKDDPKVSSILWIGYPGQSGGAALAQVIFGDYNPSGRLPVTWYPEDFTKVSMLDMSMRPNPRRDYPGRTYRFYTGPRLFNFGDGLSYTGYSYSFISAPRSLSLSSRKEEAFCTSVLRDGPCYRSLPSEENEICSRLKFEAKVAVRNDGLTLGRHSVLVFWGPPAIDLVQGGPQRQLIAFKSIELDGGSQQQVLFGIDPCKHFETVHRDGKRVLYLGEHELTVGTTVHKLLIVN